MLPERLYTLRKSHHLSQEQLAEALGVSRQAISKWESGTSTPEPDKLIAISRYFGVTLDALMLGTDEGNREAETAAKPTPSPAPTGRQPRPLAGFILSLSGVLCMLIWGLLAIFAPAASAELAASSTVTLDGSGLLLIAALAAIVLGALLLLRHDHKGDHR